MEAPAARENAAPGSMLLEYRIPGAGGGTVVRLADDSECRLDDRDGVAVPAYLTRGPCWLRSSPGPDGPGGSGAPGGSGLGGPVRPFRLEVPFGAVEVAGATAVVVGFPGGTSLVGAVAGQPVLVDGTGARLSLRESGVALLGRGGARVLEDRGLDGVVNPAWLAANVELDLAGTGAGGEGGEGGEGPAAQAIEATGPAVAAALPTEAPAGGAVGPAVAEPVAVEPLPAEPLPAEPVPASDRESEEEAAAAVAGLAAAGKGRRTGPARPAPSRRTAVLLGAAAAASVGVAVAVGVLEGGGGSGRNAVTAAGGARRATGGGAPGTSSPRTSSPVTSSPATPGVVGPTVPSGPAPAPGATPTTVAAGPQGAPSTTAVPSTTLAAARPVVNPTRCFQNGGTLEMDGTATNPATSAYRIQISAFWQNRAGTVVASASTIVSLPARTRTTWSATASYSGSLVGGGCRYGGYRILGP